jgi:hypothetical protein
MRLKQYLTESTKKYTVLGVNQDKDTCDLCGKVGLKKVVWFSECNSEGEKIGNPFATGVDCAAKLMMSGSDKKPPKKMMDNIWQVAQGLEYARKWMRKYKTAIELKKIAEAIRARYPLDAYVAFDPVETDKPMGLVLRDLTQTDGIWTMAINGKEKRWGEKTPTKALNNWLRMVT